MGNTCHYAIVVTGQPQGLREAHERAEAIFETTLPLIASPVNGYESFLIPPNGGKTGGAFAEEHRQRRTQLTKFLAQQARCDWAEICYGDDYGNDPYVSDHG